MGYQKQKWGRLNNDLLAGFMFWKLKLVFSKQSTQTEVEIGLQ